MSNRTYYKIEEGRQAGVDSEGEIRKLGEVEADEYHVGWISPEGQTYESYIEYLTATISGDVIDAEAHTGKFQSRAWLVERCVELIVEHVPDEYIEEVTKKLVDDIRIHLWLRGLRNA